MAAFFEASVIPAQTLHRPGFPRPDHHNESAWLDPLNVAITGGTALQADLLTYLKAAARKPAQQWTRERVVRWVVDIGMDKYAEKFKAMTGRRLLQLTKLDIKDIVDSNLDAQLLTDAIDDLRKRDDELDQGLENLAEENLATHNIKEEMAYESGDLPEQMKLPPIRTGVAPHFGTPSVASSESARSPLQAPHHNQPLRNELMTGAQHLSNNNSEQRSESEYRSERSEPMQGRPADQANLRLEELGFLGRKEIGHLVFFHPTHILKSFLKGKKGVDNEQAVSEILECGEKRQNIVSLLYEYMNLLDIQGIGLVEATDRNPSIGHIVGAFWEMHDICMEVKGNRSNCLQLNAFGQDILRAFDAEGKKVSYLSDEVIESIMDLLEQGIKLMSMNASPGWFKRMTIDDRSTEYFQSVHNAILEILREMLLDTLPNGRQLTYGEYKESSRPLRRLLKQIGSGSLDNGIDIIQSNEEALASVSQLIGIPREDIAKDLQTNDQIPDFDLLTTLAHSSFSGDYSPTALATNRNKEYQTVFLQYDQNQSGYLEYDELRKALADLGLLEGLRTTEIEPYAMQQLQLVDPDGTGKMDFDQFVTFYQSVSTTKARSELRSALGPQAEKHLKKIFNSFVSFGVRQTMQEMDGAKFSKLCRDCQLLNRSFTPIDCDLVFAKTKLKGQRRLSFDGFLSALLKIAEKRGQPLEEVVSAILTAGGPKYKRCTKTDYVKFHDDKSTYTGVYSRGGPTNVEPSKNLSDLLDRSESDVRGVKKRLSSGSGEAPLTYKSGSIPRQGGLANQMPEAVRSTDTSTTSKPATRRESYTGSSDGSRSHRLSQPGTDPIDSASLNRRASRSGALPPAHPPAKARTTSGSSPYQAPKATSQSSTPPQHREFGGKEVFRADSEDTVGYESSSNGSHATGFETASFDAPSLRLQSSIQGPGQSHQILAKISPGEEVRASSPTLKEELREIFAAFANFGNRASSDGAAELDGSKFAKLCRESLLLNSSFTSTSVDIIFSRVKAKGARKLSFKEFEKAIEAIATEKKVSLDAVTRQIVASKGPKRVGTTPTGHVRLHDDKANYTGVAKAGGPSVVDKQITLQSLTDRSSTAHTANRPRMTA